MPRGPLLRKLDGRRPHAARALPRALSAANAAVRRNALLLLIDVFPLVVRAATAARRRKWSSKHGLHKPWPARLLQHDPDAAAARTRGAGLLLAAESARARAVAAPLLPPAAPQDPDASEQEQDAGLSRQLAAVADALADPAPAVRAAAAAGVCGVLDLYWEIIPSATTAAFVAKLTGEGGRRGRGPAVLTSTPAAKRALHAWSASRPGSLLRRELLARPCSAQRPV